MQSDGKELSTGLKSMSTWQELYLAAILETDDTNLLDRIHAVRQAIAERLRDISRSSNGASEVERNDIADAMEALRALAKERAVAAD